MNYEYHIVTDTESNGPFDLVTVLKKIRNGSITREIQVKRNDLDDAKPAQDWEELKDFFAQKNTIAEKHSASTKRFYLRDVLKNGWAFFQQNSMSAVYSSFVIVGTVISILLLNTILPPGFQIFSYIVAIILFHLLLSCYLILMLRMTRGQLTDVSHVFAKIAKVKHGILKLLCVSIIVSFPLVVGAVLLSFDKLLLSLAGLFVIVVPGLYVLTVYSFAPLLITEQDYGVWGAMEVSRNSIFKSHRDNFGVYYALNALNFIAGLMAVFPIALALPITMSALSECYDELFS